MELLELKQKANEVRKGIVTAVHAAKSGHPGGSLSAADILTYLYFEEMNIDPAQPKKEMCIRDRLITDGQITYVRVDSYKILGSSFPGVPVPTPFIVARCV